MLSHYSPYLIDRRLTFLPLEIYVGWAPFPISNKLFRNLYFLLNQQILRSGAARDWKITRGTEVVVDSYSSYFFPLKKMGIL